MWRTKTWTGGDLTPLKKESRRSQRKGAVKKKEKKRMGKKENGFSEMNTKGGSGSKLEEKGE